MEAMTLRIRRQRVYIGPFGGRSVVGTKAGEQDSELR